LLLFLVLMLVFSATSLSIQGYHGTPVEIRDPTHHCGSELLWQLKHQNKTRGLRKTFCPILGRCDRPSIRDASPISPLTIRIAVTVVRTQVKQSDINGQLKTLMDDFAPYNIAFQLVKTTFIEPDQEYCISSFNPQSAVWYKEAQNLKAQYAYNPLNVLNIVAMCQNSGNFGTLLGFGVFPWDMDANTEFGGIWMNKRFVKEGDRTLSHEMGHVLGLWHTFHGIGETSGCDSGCRENVHSSKDATADYIGDFCADTPATPMNYECSNPEGTDCNNVQWGNTDYNNFMSYGPDSCITNFSPQQNQRMHCWVCDSLSNYLMSNDGCKKNL